MAKYSVGQKVKIIDDREIYTNYYNWITNNKLSMSNDNIRELWSKYLATKENDCKNGTELTVVTTSCHEGCRYNVIYLCKDTEGNPVLINEEGLEPIKDLKWTDLKIGDVLKNKVYGFSTMITGIDKSDSTSTHVFIYGSWISDEQLAEQWEKVE